MIRYESIDSCGNKIEGVTPKQTGNEHGRRKQYKTNIEESRQKEADGKVACKGHRRQEGTQKRKPRNKSEINKEEQKHIIRVGQDKISSSAGCGRKATMY